MCDQQTPVSSEFLFSNKNQNKIMNYYEEKGDFLKYLRKTMRIMRLSLFLIILSTAMAFSANSYSQNAKLTVDLNNATVKEVLKAIENQSEFLFFYQEKHVDLDRQVSLHVTDQDVETILNQLFAGTDNIYVINDRQIVIGKAPRKELEKQIQSIKGNVIPAIDQPQQKEITGTITDEDGLPLPGVSVIVKGTTIGTVTNGDGEFSLNVPLNAEILQFSFVGMRTLEIEVGNQTNINVTMNIDAIGIEEVVAIGYGTQKKSDITGTVASLNQEKLQKISTSNVAQVLQGAVSGVSIMQSAGGAQAGGQNILIRGRSSISAGTSPLIVIDGVPYSGIITDINPNDINSLEVLKDASSTAIYGSRGSNGVILISTKGGFETKTTVAYDGYYSTQEYINIPEIMDGEQFYNVKRSYVNPVATITDSEQAVYDSKAWVNYYDLVMRKGVSQNHNLSVSGGTKKIGYFISGNYVDTKGLAINDDYTRISTRVNVDAFVFDWLRIGTRSSFSHRDLSGAAPDFQAAFWMNPLSKPYNDDGTIALYPWPEEKFYTSPLHPLLYDDSELGYRIITNNYVEVDIPFIEGLQYKILSGNMYNTYQHYRYEPVTTPRGLAVQGSMFGQNIFNKNMSIDNIVTYEREYDKHRIFFTGLYSYENWSRHADITYASRFPNDILTYYGVGQAAVVTNSLEYDETKLISQMGRLNYTYDNRYILTATVRRDGFSGFGENNKFGIFPSFAFGWNIANEEFFSPKDILNTLKLRVSWGKSGNQAIGAYSTIAKLGEMSTVAGSQNAIGYIPTTLSSPELGWETTESTNIGLDFGIFSNRITGDFNIYNANTDGLLLNRAISYVTGFNTVRQNIGKINNKGLEISVNSRNIDGSDFKWTTYGNISFNKNKIVSLYGLKNEDGSLADDIGNRWFIGKPINVFYDYVFDGIWQLDESAEAAIYGTQPGYIKLKDLNEDGKITATDDKMIIGQTDPKFIWGLTNTFMYRFVSLRIFVHGIQGITKENPFLQDNLDRDVRKNDIVKDWWTPTNPSNTVAAADFNSTRLPYRAGRFEDASFVRLKEVQLSFEMPKRLLENFKMEQFSIFFTGRNLMTFTKYGGLDPELNSGIHIIPLQKEYIVGLKIGF
jgi:TonB-linked SusC/RagA family outer membrane protein